jgi:hypothetical protein
VEAVDEFEAERDQKRDEEQQERRERRDFDAGGVDVRIDAVGDEQQDGGDNAPEENAGKRVNSAG